MSTLDLYLEWGQDFVLSDAGTLQVALNWDQVRERIIRRILTNPGQVLPAGNFTPPDYIFDPNYGIGGGALVSQNPTKAFIHSLTSKITRGVLSDAAVDPGYQPQVVIQQPEPNIMIILVGLKLLTGQPQAFSIRVGD
jgi:hypothetical protein